MSAPTLPPEIEAAMLTFGCASGEGRSVDALEEIAAARADLRTAIATAIANAREAGRREVIGAASTAEDYEQALRDSIRSWQDATGLRVPEPGKLRPAMSREDAERLVDANDDETLAATGDTTARDALLAALTGTNPTPNTSPVEPRRPVLGMAVRS